MSEVKQAQEDYEKNKLFYNAKSPTFAPKKPRMKYHKKTAPKRKIG